jgi:penicillin-binding protein 1B
MSGMFRRRIFGEIEPGRSKFWRYLRYAFLALALCAASFTLYLDFRVRSEFEGRRFALPARIYARPLELHTGLRITQSDVIDELRENNYHEGIREGDSGWFVRDGDWLEIAVRPFRFWDGSQNPLRVRTNFDTNGVVKVQDAQGLDLPLARLEPLPIGGIYPGNNQDRVLVRLSEVPKPLVQALVSTEDRAFYTHHGYDLRGIARAAWSFLRGKGLQGGSTLTQQLVKNFFLTPERTLQRKGTELIMSVLLELHYGKEEILETYLNEIYLGQDRDRAIHGVGLASLHYFGKTVDRLNLPEGALLVAMVKGPGVFDP